MGNFLTNHPNIRNGIVSAAAIGAVVGPVACRSEQQSSCDSPTPNQAVSAPGPERYANAANYLTSSERDQRLQSFAQAQVKKALDAHQADPKKIGLYFNPEVKDPETPPPARRIGATGPEEWGVVTNFFGGGEGSALFSAVVCMGTDGHIKLDKGVRKLHVAEYKSGYPTEGDTQISIEFPQSKQDNHDFTCLWESNPPAPGARLGENGVVSVELRKYDQHGDAPFGEWTTITQTCESGDKLAVATKSQLQGTDIEVTSGISSLVNRLGQ